MGCGGQANPIEETITTCPPESQNKDPPDIKKVEEPVAPLPQMEVEPQEIITQTTTQSDDSQNNQIVKKNSSKDLSLKTPLFEQDDLDESIHRTGSITQSVHRRKITKKSKLHIQGSTVDEEVTDHQQQIRMSDMYTADFKLQNMNTFDTRLNSIDMRKQTTLSLTYNTPEKLLKLFEKISKNGFITSQDFLKFCSRRFKELPKREVLKAFSAADSQQKGVIEFDEFESLIIGLDSLQEQVQATLNQQQMQNKLLYEEMDQGGTGHITLANFIETLSKQYPDLDEQIFIDYFKMSDSDQNGTIEMKEFPYLMYLIKTRVKQMQGITSVK